MKKIKIRLFILSMIFVLCYMPNEMAYSTLRTEDSVTIEGGKVIEGAVLGDREGEIFIEFTEDTRVLYASDHTRYEGAILPPEQIPFPGRAPRTRMRPIKTFEVITNTADDVKFIDRFDIMSDKAKLRMEILNPDEFERNARVKIFATIMSSRSVTDESSGFEQTIDTSDHLAVWEYLGQDEDTEEDQWLRMGGKIETMEDETENMKIFMSTIKGSGIFTIFDENPPPSYVPPFPIDQIQSAEDSPYPSVEEPTIAPDESDPEIPMEGAEDEENSEPGINEDGDPLPPETSAPNESDDRVIPSLEGNDSPTSTNPDSSTTTTTETEGNSTSSNTENKKTDTTAIPTDGTLPKSGQKESEDISLFFPLLLINLLGLLGLGIYFSIRQKPY